MIREISIETRDNSDEKPQPELALFGPSEMEPIESSKDEQSLPGLLAPHQDSDSDERDDYWFDNHPHSDDQQMITGFSQASKQYDHEERREDSSEEDSSSPE